MTRLALVLIALCSSSAFAQVLIPAAVLPPVTDKRAPEGFALAMQARANAAGIADGLALPTRWSEAEWHAAIPGLGHSSPIVWGERIFLTSAVSGDPDSIFVHGLDGRIDRRTDPAEQCEAARPLANPRRGETG